MILDTESNKSERGFILISVAIALSIAVIVLTITLSSHFRGVETSREYESIQEMNRLKDAITGTSIENFGFIGDMGRLPNSLSELNTQGTQTAFHTTDGTTPHFGSVGMGWRGPYYKYGKTDDDYLKDAWGRQYVYVITGTVTSGGGITLNQRTAQIISNGPDGAYPSSDDLYAEPIVEKTNLIIRVVKVMSDQTMTNVTIDVFSSNNGEQTQTTAPTITFTGDGGQETSVPIANLHQGVHAFNINFGVMDETGYVYIIGGDANKYKFAVPVGLKK